MNLNVDLLANVIIQQYFLLHSRCLIILTDGHNNFEFSENIPIITVGSNSSYVNNNAIFRYHGCQGIVIKSAKPLSLFKSIEKEIKLCMERFNKRKYLFIPTKNMVENLMDIFELDELKYVCDLLIIQEEEEIKIKNENFWKIEDNIYSLWTHTYVGSIKNNDKILLDIWFSNNHSFMFNYNLYPNKLENQMGRELKMATFQYEPYSIIGSTVDKHQGSELLTATMFAKMYNMTPTPVINPEDYWGEIFDNWSGNGLLGNLAADRADIGFSALYTWEVDYHFLDLSKPLVRTGITCLVPAPKLAAGWLTPLFSYSSAMWIAVGTLFVICIPSLFFINLFYSNRKKMTRKSRIHIFGQSIYSIIKLFILQILTKDEIPDSTNGSYFMGLLFLFSLFLTSTYSSGLASIMTIPRYENPINTVEEFAKSGLYWGATQEAWISSIEYVEEYVYQEIVRRFKAEPEEILRKYSKTESFAFSLERLPHDNYAIGTYIKEDVIGNFHLMQEDFYWEQCVMMTRKSSVLLPLLDMFILRVFEAGLISHWQNEATLLFMDAKVQQAVKYYHHQHKEHNIVKLKWTHVEGAFAILSIGYIISILVFISELFSVKLKRNIKKIDENSIS